VDIDPERERLRSSKETLLKGFSNKPLNYNLEKEHGQSVAVANTDAG